MTFGHASICLPWRLRWCQTANSSHLRPLATAAVRLQQAGRFDIDTPIRRYLPTVTDDKALVRNLVTDPLKMSRTVAESLPASRGGDALQPRQQQ
jgi:hypothetical protein